MVDRVGEGDRPPRTVIDRTRPAPRPGRAESRTKGRATGRTKGRSSGRAPGRAKGLGAVGLAAALLAAALATLTPQAASADTVGAGSFTTTPAGSLPTGCGSISTNPRQWVTANAPAGAVPTNDWWSSILFKRTDCQYGSPMQAHPLGFQPHAGGLGFSYTTTPAISGTATGVGEYHFPYTEDFVAGVTGLASPDVKVDGWSDWTVSPYFSDGTRTLRATVGEGLPFAYFRTSGGSAQISASGGAALTVWSNSGSTVGYTINGHDYVAYAPTGATWSVSGGVLTSSLAGKDYYSVAVLPTTPQTSASERAGLATSYGRYAYDEVTGTTVSYRYDEASSTVTTSYAYTTTAHEGSATGTVAALLPHQWQHLTGATPLPETYVSARGALKVLTGATSFTTSMPFQGVLPEVPAVADSSGADGTTEQNDLNAELANPMNQQKDDTYWTGKGLGRAARLAEISDQTGNTAVRDSALSAIKSTLTDWFTASAGKTGHLFYYDKNWGTLIGYPASYGSDQELNDHHFHYGYYIAAAATLARFDPTWASASQYGGMVDMLIRDANDYDRTDTRFPYLRDFDIYDGHDWASGHGNFAAGNNQESSSEGMNFDNALIQWGEATGNTAVRDAGIYMYTTQAAAIQDYWFDTQQQVFPSSFPHHEVGMVWGDGAAYSTWFSSAPSQIQGINLLPVTGGHLYLGDDPNYVLTDYKDMLTNSNSTQPPLWPDIWYEFLALGDGQQALADFNANSGLTSEEGESKAHTFHWIRNLAALGHVDTTVTADHPLAAVFSNGGARTYVAADVTSSPITVTFSDGHVVQVPAGKTVASGALNWSGGSAAGGPSTSASPSSSPTPSPTPSPTGSPTPSPSPTGPSGSPTLYPQANGSVTGSPGSTASTATISSAGGATYDGTPHNASTFTATGLNLAYNGGTTAFNLALDAGTAVGNGTQIRISYDCTGSGTWNRTETYHYYATDASPGYEHATQTVGLETTTGTLCTLTNGTVKIEIWNAIGTAPTTLGTGNQSVITLPYSGTVTSSPTPTPTPSPTGPSGSPTLYPQANGSVTGSPGSTASTATISSAGGATYDGTPHNASTFTATGHNLAYNGGTTAFNLALDAGTAVGNGTQIRISYDCTGSGTWNRTETYHYYATDASPGYEHATQTVGLETTTGTLCTLTNGTVKIEIWNAIGTAPTTLGTGNQSVITLPYS
ncbi:glycosyl hydrolase [Kitasatospora sp. NPDC058965]|uniref:glycosyl hydrolase n=1 Tax=Kitasatospora sp. NPDC058965 TaxID=3346682 RepID=UPI0036D0FCD9